MKKYKVNFSAKYDKITLYTYLNNKKEYAIYNVLENNTEFEFELPDDMQWYGRLTNLDGNYFLIFVTDQDGLFQLCPEEL